MNSPIHATADGTNGVGSGDLKFLGLFWEQPEDVIKQVLETLTPKFREFVENPPPDTVPDKFPGRKHFGNRDTRVIHKDKLQYRPHKKGSVGIGVRYIHQPSDPLATCSNPYCVVPKDYLFVCQRSSIGNHEQKCRANALFRKKTSIVSGSSSSNSSNKEEEGEKGGGGEVITFEPSPPLMPIYSSPFMNANAKQMRNAFLEKFSDRFKFAFSVEDDIGPDMSIENIEAMWTTIEHYNIRPYNLTACWVPTIAKPGFARIYARICKLRNGPTLPGHAYLHAVQCEMVTDQFTGKHISCTRPSHLQTGPEKNNARQSLTKRRVLESKEYAELLESFIVRFQDLLAEENQRFEENEKMGKKSI